MPERNPAWERDELILALDLYFRFNPSHISKNHPEVVKLSEVLNTLPIHKDRPDAPRFRNTNGVYMKMCNFLGLDPHYHGEGLSQRGQKDEEVWNEFAHDPGYLHQVAESIKQGVQDLSHLADESFDDEEGCGEGKVLYRLHRMRERNSGVVKKAKERAIKSGEGLRCSVCKFDFQQAYGSLGDGFIECHHTKPISEYKSGDQTKVTDLRLVCSNCHRMLHKRKPWATVDELRTIVETQRK